LRLKQLVILGFKSFADKTVIEFSPGITGIVGPNGCGKSNIADAFRWVLGEQSAKSMRGNKMPDVIFSGTSKRPALNFAEVTITLTEINGELPIEYQEVAVTRRLHRNGESDYFLNNRPVRLKDVQALFMDSGIGKSAFSIFEQGKIDQVIQYSPLERRHIFEEAAGILRFLHRKREALRKLEQADQNTSRVRDIHQEVEKQISVLAEQAEKARAYKICKNQLETAEKALFVTKWQNLERKMKDLSKKEHELKIQQNGLNEHLEGSHQELSNAKQALNNADQALRAKSEVLFKARSAKEIKAREKISHQERFKEQTTKEKRWQDELKQLQKKQVSYQQERTTLEQQLSQIQTVVLEQEKIVELERQRAKTQDELLSNLRQQQQHSQQERVKFLQLEGHSESELKQNKVRQDSLLEKQQSYQDRKNNLGGIISDLSHVHAEKKREMQSVEKAVDEQKALFAQQNLALQTLSQSIDSTRHSFEIVKQESSEIKARHKILTRMREDHEGFSSGSKKLLQAAQDQKSPLFQLMRPLYECISPEKGAEKALATVMRQYAHTLVVETREALNTVLQYAEEHRLKDFSLICITELQESDRLNLRSLISQMSENKLSSHFLQSIAIVDNVEAAFTLVHNHKGAAAWIGKNMFLDFHGVLFCSGQSENNVFLREAEIKALEAKLAQLEQDREQHETKGKELSLQRDTLRGEHSALDKSIRRDEMKLVEVNFGVQRYANDLEKAKQEEGSLSQELIRIQSILEEIAIKITDLAQKHTAARQKGVDILKQYAVLEEELQKQQKVAKQENASLQEQEALYRKAFDEQKKIQHSLHIIEIKELETTTQQKRIMEEIASSQEMQATIQKQGVEVDHTLQDVEKSLLETTVNCTELEKEVLICKSGIDSIEGKIQVFRERLRQCQEEIHRIGVQKAQLQSSLQNLVYELQERYQLTIEDAQALVVPPGSGIEIPIDQQEKQVRALRQQIEQAGDINMTSIEEFDKQKGRHQFLEKQLGDLDGSKQELLQIITELDTESRKIFKETFQLIRANFQKNFQILFNGGEADLQLTEAADILEAGIEIIAKPPGKQMRAISLMSGGEKCLTAMALLFAIFEVKPSPFCLLDEIDAPLDDSNVERFLNVVKQFVERCQFIIITHNKRTMAIADVLCGVSMEEKGVSKLLAIEFAKQAEPIYASY